MRPCSVTRSNKSLILLVWSSTSTQTLDPSVLSAADCQNTKALVENANVWLALELKPKNLTAFTDNKIVSRGRDRQTDWLTDWLTDRQTQTERERGQTKAGKREDRNEREAFSWWWIGVQNNRNRFLAAVFLFCCQSFCQIVNLHRFFLQFCPLYVNFQYDWMPAEENSTNGGSNDIQKHIKPVFAAVFFLHAHFFSSIQHCFCAVFKKKKTNKKKNKN